MPLTSTLFSFQKAFPASTTAALAILQKDTITFQSCPLASHQAVDQRTCYTNLSVPCCKSTIIGPYSSNQAHRPQAEVYQNTLKRTPTDITMEPLRKIFGFTETSEPLNFISEFGLEEYVAPFILCLTVLKMESFTTQATTLTPE